MKKTFALMLATLGMYACTPVIIDEEPANAPTNKLHISTRSSTDISYPLTLYAFDSESESIITRVTLESQADNTPQLELPRGNYHIIALAGSEDCTIPNNPTLEDAISLPDINFTTQPIQMGSASSNVTQDADINITLYNQVAAINLSLADIPAEVTAVSVTFSLLHNKLGFNGTMTGNSSATVELAKSGDLWVAAPFYTLPSSGDKLTLSITTTSPSGKQTYGYTHNKSLVANTPYTLIGSFEAGFTINGLIELAGWNTPEEIVFTFGTEDVEEEDDPNNDDSNENDDNKVNNGENEDGSITVAAIPEAGDIWDGHFVAAVADATESSAELLLLSATEWTDITSSLHAETPSMATDIVSAYKEGELTGWSIPTQDEAIKLIQSIGTSKLTTTNATLRSNNMDIISTGEDASKNSVRYLCDNGGYAFTWEQLSKPSRCGTSRSYHLRAVKRIKVVTNDE